MGEPSRARQKRPLPEDDDDSDSDSNKPMQKRVRFPKGKKVKTGEEKVEAWKIYEEDDSEVSNVRNAAKERALRRNVIAANLLTEENRGMAHDISTAEVQYEENETFNDDGIQIEPFNLEKEREEGYFDDSGNFIEYVGNETKDAWLDSVEVDPKLADKGIMTAKVEDDVEDLTSKDVGKMKRRIADVLEPGETVLRALRRLKGTSNNRKEKMSAETKLLFDQLTEDAMRLLENGEYNVYDEKREVFEREAEGYERLARAKGEGNSMDLGQGESKFTATIGSASNGVVGTSSAVLVNDGSNPNASTLDIQPTNDDDSFDIFAEDDEQVTVNPTSDESNLITGLSSEGGEGLQNDYVYDESSGYYYSSSSGYYYDSSSGLYCSATTGQWYAYDEATGSYDVIQETASTATAS